MTSNFKELFELLKPHILHFVWVGFYIRKERNPDAEVVGVNAKALSLVSKEYTKTRIERKIKDLNLPFVLIDENPETSYFQIIIN